MEIRKEGLGGQAITFTAKSGSLNLLINNQNSLSISPELTRKGSFVVVISKEKTEDAGGKRYQTLVQNVRYQGSLKCIDACTKESVPIRYRLDC